MPNRSHIEKLKLSVTDWNNWRSSNPEIIPDLSGVYLIGANLGGGDKWELRRWHLRYDEIYKEEKKQLTNFFVDAKNIFDSLDDIDQDYVILENLKLRGANFIQANLSRANLRGANLIDVDLSGTDLSEADLTGADLRRANLSGASLFKADLRDADLQDTNLLNSYLVNANLSGASLQGKNLSRLNLFGAKLKGSDLRDSDLTESNLEYVNLQYADLREAKLRKANLCNALLKNANLSKANLNDANLTKADLRDIVFDGANLKGAIFENAVLSGSIGDANLANAKRLDEVRHIGPSSISFETVDLAKGDIPLSFLKGCGLSDLQIETTKLASPGLDSEQVTDIIYRIHQLYMGVGIKFYTCFISYNNVDHNFAQRLHSDLQKSGVQCWFASEDMRIGDRIRSTIDSQIRVRDKLLVILSENSIRSEWVGDEVEAALEEERLSNRLILFPIRLDNAVLDARGDWAAKIKRRRHIGDFSNWRDASAYRKAFDQLLEDLKTSSSLENDQR